MGHYGPHRVAVMLIFLAWIAVLVVLVKLKVPWWVWAIFVLGSALALIGAHA